MRFQLECTAAPAVEPVTLAEMKLFARVSISEDDAQLGVIISSARQYVENALGRQFITATYKLTLPRFPTGYDHCGVMWSNEIMLPRSPLQSVSSITYLDNDGNRQTLAAASYLVTTSAAPGYIEPAYLCEWPAVREQSDSVQVIYKAGYGDLASDVPEAAKLAIMQLGAWLYGQREPVIVGTIQTQALYICEALCGHLREGYHW